MSRRVPCVGKMLVASTAGLMLCAGCGTQVGIAASPSEIYVEVGGTVVVNVVGVLDTGSLTAVSAPLTITSSDSAIVAVSGEVVMGIVEGTAVLTITDGVFTTTAKVHVVAAGTLPTELVVTPTSVWCTPASDDTQLEVFAIFASEAGEDITDRASYGSSDSSIALVTAEGLVVCVGEGEVTVAAQYRGVSDTINVVVGATPPLAIAFSSSTLTCAPGESYEVQVLASWEDGSRTDVSLSAAYSSTDDTVAAASLGQVQCLSEGSATIVGDVLGVIGVLEVDVQAVAPAPDELVDLRISPSSVDCGLAQAAAFAVIAEYGDGTTVDVTSSSQTQYLSADSSVALVLQGQVLCVQQGQTTVQATFGDLVASVTVNVW
ncbi:MAG: hypothetical protein JSU86_19725 [Phycisphaerales bacterium]|nr:MAG: hypothetical protein JSU86_19725 [Phycisphaerales bacterium]